MNTVKCPLCSYSIEISNKPFHGQIIPCPGCDANLEVIRVQPLELDWPYDDEGYLEIYEDEDYDQFDGLPDR